MGDINLPLVTFFMIAIEIEFHFPL